MSTRSLIESMEDFIPTIGKKSSRQPLVRPIKESAVHSNYLANGIRKIVSFKTDKECLKYALEEYKDALFLDVICVKDTREYIKSRKRLQIIKKYSTEAANEIYSLEAENQGENFLTKIKKFFIGIYERFMNFITAFGKSIMLKIKTFTAQFANKIYKDFKKEDFVNLDQEISAIPFDMNAVKNASNNPEVKDIEHICKKMEDDLKILESNIKSLKENQDSESGKIIKGMRSEYSSSGEDGNRKNIKEMINNMLYNHSSDKKPEAKKMKISEYLNCQPGQEPAALELLSEKSLNDIKKMVEFSNKINKTLTAGLKLLKKLDEKNAGKDHAKVKEISKVFNTHKNELSRNVVFYTYFATELLNIRSKVASAIKMGLKKTKDNKDKKSE